MGGQRVCKAHFHRSGIGSLWNERTDGRLSREDIRATNTHRRAPLARWRLSNGAAAGMTQKAPAPSEAGILEMMADTGLSSRKRGMAHPGLAPECLRVSNHSKNTSNGPRPRGLPGVNLCGTGNEEQIQAGRATRERLAALEFGQ